MLIILKDLGLEYIPSEGRNRRYVLVKCPKCGKEYKLMKSSAIKTTKCWDCRKTYLGESTSRLGTIFYDMHHRCNNANNKHYNSYGGRGIVVSAEWNTYSSFKKWALSNGYENNLTIDRIDVDGNYEPSNCRWATWKTQALNKRFSESRGIRKVGNKFQARVKANKKEMFIGSFNTFEEAKKGRIKFLVENNMQEYI